MFPGLGMNSEEHEQSEGNVKSLRGEMLRPLEGFNQKGEGHKCYPQTLEEGQVEVALNLSVGRKGGLTVRKTF